MSLDTDIKQLADRLRQSNPDTADRLDSLAEAVHPDGDPSGWAGVDIFEALNPSGVGQDVRESMLANKGLAARERWRNFLALLPVPLTWLGLLYASVGYDQALTANKDLLTEPFLLLWERGFEGLVSPPWSILGFLTFSHVAIGDVLILSIVLILTWTTHSEINVRQTQREREARQIEREVARVAWSAGLLLSRRTSPRASDDRSRLTLEALLDELRAERERGAQLAAEREREARDLRTFGSEFRVGAQELKRVTGQIGLTFDSMLKVTTDLGDQIRDLSQDEEHVEQSLTQMADGFANLVRLQETATTALVNGGAQLGEVADRAVSSSATIADGLDTLKASVNALGEQSSRTASNQAEAIESMTQALAETAHAVGALQHASGEIHTVLMGLSAVAPRMDAAAEQQLHAAALMSASVQQYIGTTSTLVSGVTRAMERFGGATEDLRATVDALADQLAAAGVAKPKRNAPWFARILPSRWRQEPANPPGLAEDNVADEQEEPATPAGTLR